VEKTAYEVCYEAANRQNWLTVPLQGLAATLAVVPTFKHLLKEGVPHHNPKLDKAHR
jgi:hypothetical protein